MTTMVRVLFAAAAIFLFLFAAVWAFVVGAVGLALGFLGLVCLTFAGLPEPASRRG